MKTQEIETLFTSKIKNFKKMAELVSVIHYH
jgi:hypothetical protein